MSDDSPHRLRPTTSDSPDSTGDGPDRRSVLRGSLATAATLGTPLAGGFTAATTSAAATETEEVIEEYSRPERVAEAARANEALFAALADLGFGDETLTEGIRVSAYDVDGELLPEQRLYVATPLGVLTAVVSPDGVPFGPYADVITSPEMMERATFEWPSERVSELPDGRLAFRRRPDGWDEPGFEGAERIDDVPVVERMCGSGSSDPRQWECTGPSASDECAYVTCCGHVEILNPAECPGIGGGDTVRFDWCEGLADECGESCWQESDGTCECIQIPHFNC